MKFRSQVLIACAVVAAVSFAHIDAQTTSTGKKTKSGGKSVGSDPQTSTAKKEKSGHAAHAMAASKPGTKAIAVLYPTQGNNVRGVVTFTKMGKGVHVIADIEGLTPGKHGFHVHQFGDCSAPDGSSAGDHFNPQGKQHGAPDGKVRHAGDLGNISADSQGKAHYELMDNTISLSGKNSIIGYAVIVHQNPDDLTSQPSGAAGPRVACGVVGVAK